MGAVKATMLSYDEALEQFIDEPTPDNRQTMLDAFDRERAYSRSLGTLAEVPA
jgi:hypothetical protein